jgi:hypothetical protein
VLDVWFSSDCVCFKIDHLSNINEMQAFNTANVYGVPVGRRENNELLWVKGLSSKPSGKYIVAPNLCL